MAVSPEFPESQSNGDLASPWSNPYYPTQLNIQYSDGGGDAIGRLFVWWDGYTPDMDLLGPLVRVADYQP